MESKPQIAFEGLEPSDAISARVRKEIAKMEQIFGRITACRVVVGKPQKRHARGDLFTASVHLTLPDGREVVANRNPPEDHAHEDVYVAIRDIFAAARRQLQDEARKLRGDVKRHDPGPEAIVGTIIAEDDYGFLETTDGREIYFHKNSVINNGFDKLKTGDRVSFSEALGDKGPQATTVRPI